MIANPEMLDSALALARDGFLVFPLVYGTKIPEGGSSGFKDATANVVVIRRLFGGSYRRNLGVRTGAASRFWVLDIDAPESLAALEASHGRLPETRMVRSSRGHHYWWRLGSVPIPCRNSKIAPSIDAKGDGGYVLVPPSVHPDGVVYEWHNDAPLVEAPAWLVELAVKREAPSVSERAVAYQRHPDSVGGPLSYGRAALQRETALLAGAGAGGRNHQLNRSAFALYQLVAGGVLDGSEVERGLIEACVANGLAADTKSGGMSQVMRTIRSGARAGLQHPRSSKGRTR